MLSTLLCSRGDSQPISEATRGYSVRPKYRLPGEILIILAESCDCTRGGVPPRANLVLVHNVFVRRKDRAHDAIGMWSETHAAPQWRIKRRRP
jgi:hypothetical protein